MAGQRELMERIRGQAASEEAARQRENRIGSLAGTFLASGENLIYSGEVIAGGLIERDTMGDDREDVTDDAPEIIEACGLTEDDMYFECDLFNTAGEDESITIVGGSGVSVANPERVIGQRQIATLRFHRTSELTLVLYIKGV